MATHVVACNAAILSNQINPVDSRNFPVNDDVQMANLENLNFCQNHAVIDF